MNAPIEAQYPQNFRQADVKKLAEHLSHFHSVVLIGSKRVGISNFLRFFLHNHEARSLYMKSEARLFVHVDLHDLVETTLHAFWALMLKRIVDAVAYDERVEDTLLNTAQHSMSQAFQIGETLFTIDAIKGVLSSLESRGVHTTIVFNRFDRLLPVTTVAFFDNLKGLVDATDQRLTYIFTTHRTLSDLHPEIFKPSSMSVFARDQYLSPANENDMRILIQTFAERYQVALSEEHIAALMQLSGGHVQYLQLMLIRFKDQSTLPSPEKLQVMYEQDEDCQLLSKELFDHLTIQEQKALTSVVDGISTDLEKTEYILNVGLYDAVTHQMLNPIFATHIQSFKKGKTSTTLTKKELALLQLLEQKKNAVVDREAITQAVWPDQFESGVSDWAIDSLVSRLRKKLRAQNSSHTVATVKTRGYTLV